MDVDSYLENTLSDLAAIFHEMVTKIQAPIVADVGGYGPGAIRIYPTHWRAF